MVFILALVPGVYAHPGGSHTSPEQYLTQPKVKTLDDKGAIKAASDIVALLVKQELKVDDLSLDSTWANTASADKKISKRGNGYFIISFKRGTIDEVLYTLISDTGELYDANFTGKFEGLLE